MSDVENPQTSKMAQLDHDAIIRVEEAVKNIAADVREMKDGNNKIMSEHESRIAKIEIVMEVVKPELTLKEFRELQTQWRDFHTTAKAWRVLGGIMGGIVTFALLQLPNILRDWGVIK